MKNQDFSDRISRISTQWTLVFQAQVESSDSATAARGELLQRYCGAAYRYLLAALRDADAAEEQAQEFALRFVRGDFRRARPEKGRFRNYLKTALVHLVTDYHRDRQAQPHLLSSGAPEPAAPTDSVDEATFAASWREELLERTWAALEKANATYHAVLLLRVQEPDLPSTQMADQLAGTIGKSMSAALVRKTLQRAQQKFADLLLDEVAASLEEPDLKMLQAELRELDLLRYCESALGRRA